MVIGIQIGKLIQVIEEVFFLSPFNILAPYSIARNYTVSQILSFKHKTFNAIICAQSYINYIKKYFYIKYIIIKFTFDRKRKTTITSVPCVHAESVFAMSLALFQGGPGNLKIYIFTLVFFQLHAIYSTVSSGNLVLVLSDSVPHLPANFQGTAWL